MTVRNRLRAWNAWVVLRRVQRMGFLRHFQHQLIARRILYTRPIRTAPRDSDAPASVHVLTWDRDWLLALWAAKTFYTYADIDWPLTFHVGGRLSRRRARSLQRHFPRSRILYPDAAAAEVEPQLRSLGLTRTLRVRRQSVMMLKFVDCLLLSRSPRVVTLDSDILFFSTPEELLVAAQDAGTTAYYNRDIATYYSITPEYAQKRFGVRPVAEINAGLTTISRSQPYLSLIEEFLEDDTLSNDSWLVEQTLHALCAARLPSRFLPNTYLVSVTPGLTTAVGDPIVAKHYPSAPRHLMYVEGMMELIERGFLGVRL